MIIVCSKKRNKQKKKSFMGEIYIIDGIWLRQAKTKHKLLKHLNQDIRESRNIKCQLGIDKFTSRYKALWNDKNYGI